MTDEAKPKYTSIPSHLKTSSDQDGNILIEGSIFGNPHVVAALVGTKSVVCETKAIGEELQFTIKLGVTKSIHDVKPITPPPATVAPGLSAADHEAQIKAGAVSKGVPVANAEPKKDVVHPEPVIAPSKPGTQAAIPATSADKAKTA